MTDFVKWLIGFTLCMILVFLGFIMITQVRLDKLYIEIHEEIDTVRIEQKYLQEKIEQLTRMNEQLKDEIKRLEEKINN